MSIRVAQQEFLLEDLTPSRESSSKSWRLRDFIALHRKTIYTITLLVFIISGIVAVAVPYYKTHGQKGVRNSEQQHGEMENYEDLVPQLRSGSMKKKYKPDAYGHSNIYLRKSSRKDDDYSSQKVRFPVARYDRKHSPLRGPFITFGPRIPIFVDRLTKQTIIFVPTGGLFIFPPLINFYGKMFSVGELIVSGYASLVSSGAPIAGPINMLPFFNPTPIFGPGIPTLSPLTGGFTGALRADYDPPNYSKRPHKYDDDDKSYESDEDDDDYQKPSYPTKNYNKRPKPSKSARCPQGMVYGVAETKKNLSVSFKEFVRNTGSFFDAAWYGFYTIPTKGKDNRVGSEHILIEAATGFRYRETLEKFYLDSSYFEMAYSGPGEEIKSHDFGDFVLGSYFEYIKVQSICHGDAVQVVFGSTLCAVNLANAQKGLLNDQNVGLKEIQKRLDVDDFSTCEKAKDASDMKYGVTTTKVKYPTSLAKFVGVAGDFFDAEWYDSETKSTKGTKNQLGAFRKIEDGRDKIFEEILLIYVSNSSYFEMAYRGPNEDIKPVEYDDFKLGYYVESLIAEPICDGFAVEVTFSLKYYVDGDLSDADETFKDDQVAGLKSIQKKLGVERFRGCDAAKSSEE